MASRRGVAILDEAIGAICRDADIPVMAPEALLKSLREHREPVRHLSAPIADTLSRMLELRCELATRADAAA